MLAVLHLIIWFCCGVIVPCVWIHFINAVWFMPVTRKFYRYTSDFDQAQQRGDLENALLALKMMDSMLRQQHIAMLVGLNWARWWKLLRGDYRRSIQ